MFFIFRFTDFLVKFLRQLEARYSNVSSILDESGIYDELAPALELVVAVQEAFNVSLIKQELIQIGIDNDTIKILAESFVNVNRVSYHNRAAKPSYLTATRLNILS